MYLMVHVVSHHRLGDTEVSGQTRVFIEGDRGDNQEATRVMHNETT